MNQNLIDAFKYWRRQSPNRAAHMAIFNARKDLVEGRKRYPANGNAMRGGTDFKVGRDSVFWCECPDDYLRRVGYADECLSMRHTGWYLEDDWSGELARGVVFQLPAAKGKPRFLSGIADPHNDGPAILSLEVFDEKEEAARNADYLAERYAEKERDYQRAWRAGQDYRELGDEIAALRTDTLELFAERRELRKLVGDKFKASCRALHQTIKANWREIKAAREKRSELFDTFGHVDAFNQ
jgi:hypothetical protein